MHTTPAIVTATAILACCAGCASLAPAHARPPTRASALDKAWVASAHRGNMAEIGAGGMAASKGSTPSIRTIGRTLRGDHAKLDKALRIQAVDLGMPLPIHENPMQRHQAATLSLRSGADFDKTFVSTQTTDHLATIRLARREANHGRVPKLRSAAKAALPTLNKHLWMLRHAFYRPTPS